MSEKPQIDDVVKYHLKIAAEREVKKFYDSMKKAGYTLTPIPELRSEEKLLDFFFKERLERLQNPPETGGNGKEPGKFKKYIENVWEAVKDVFYTTTGKTLEILDRLIGGYDEIEVKDPICPGFRTFYSRREMMESDREITQNMKLLRQRLKSGEITRDEFRTEKENLKTMRKGLWNYGRDLKTGVNF